MCVFKPIFLFIKKYLSESNKIKTNTLNELVASVVNFYKYQLNYFEESSKYLNDFIKSLLNNNDQLINEPLNEIVNQNLVDFNLKQAIEKNMLDNKMRYYKFKQCKINRAESTPFLNEINENFNYLNQINYPSTANNLISSSQINQSIKQKKQHKSKMDRNFGGSQPFIPSLFEQKRIKVMENFKEFKTSFHGKHSNDKHNKPDRLQASEYSIHTDEKEGYLLKRAFHTRMGKSWLKRKCAIENGVFLIHHYDVIILY